ncbi:hypothetical protein Lnau_1297 [Legionella nautarum]|uniref:Uncharacterized protein n=1 Tax=Legionella nautarum TaxID=45070 RepID=A0A0W0WVH2_9GAMM|nr:hypothetical protein [Legionella nautarum]KTD36313.1 hypothetical protein Lnau_1297 [Legionella nautarum]
MKRKRENETISTNESTQSDIIKERKVEASERAQLSEVEARNRGSKDAALQARKDYAQLQAEGCTPVTEIENESPAYMETYRETYEKVKTQLLERDSTNLNSTANAYSLTPYLTNTIPPTPQQTMPNSLQQNGVFYVPQIMYLNALLNLYYTNSIVLMELEKQRMAIQMEEEAIGQIANKLMEEIKIEQMADDLRAQVESEVKDGKKIFSGSDEISWEEAKTLEREQIFPEDTSAGMGTNWCDFFQSISTETVYPSDMPAPNGTKDTFPNL